MRKACIFCLNSDKPNPKVKVKIEEPETDNEAEMLIPSAASRKISSDVKKVQFS